MSNRLRTMQICISDIPPERIINHPSGKQYVSLTTFDYDETNDRDEDFPVMLSLSQEENTKRKAGEKVKRIYVGHGKIWNNG